MCTRCYQKRWRKTEDRKRWSSRKYPGGCTKCGTTKAKHQGKGLCSSCYSLQYKQEHPERILELARESYHRNRDERREKWKQLYCTDAVFRRKHQERVFRGKYSGNGVLALERAKFRCEVCGYDKVPAILEVHHQDGTRTNNVLHNLLVVCPNCHRERHYGS